jgi:N-glycosylase/DNA lyase
MSLPVLLQSAWMRLSSTSSMRLGPTLLNGQSFGWRPSADGSFSGVVGSRVVTLRERDDFVEFSEWRPTGAESAAAGASASTQPALLHELRDYFQLDVNMGDLVMQWSGASARMAAIARVLPGMRILRQPPWECLVAFICSSNNNISRISGMLERLRESLGRPIGISSQETGASSLAPSSAQSWHAFPTVQELGEASEDSLRSLGMGYRAKFLKGSAVKIQDAGGEPYLIGLRSAPRAAAKAALMLLPGVGPKVADCVGLFSLDQADAIPVDTHVWTIACRDLDASLSEAKSLTPAVYERVGNIFRDTYGARAGWAHSLLFAAELPIFTSQLPPDLQQTMKTHKVEEKAVKAVKRAEARRRKLARHMAAAPVQEELTEISAGKTDEGDAALPKVKTRRKKAREIVRGQQSDGGSPIEAPAVAAVITAATDKPPRSKRSRKD